MIHSLTERYRHKIKTVEELSALLGARPREKKVIMCHGVFDVVHPGHVRHLIYAKHKADILVASLTADAHITKGAYRPHVPQDLRAANLAAFEIVDYVIIDQNATPLDNIRRLEPDYFAKGYEYVAGGLPPKTAEEASVVQSYGGELIFTPGDVVYSSSRLIDLALPSLKIDKLLLLMEQEGLSFDGLRATVGRLGGRRVHVLGDTIVDSHTRAAMIGGQTKTPTLSVRFEERTDFIGGAGIVAKHLRAGGAEVTFTTVLGGDPLRDFVLEGLRRDGVIVNATIDQTRPTTNKNAIIVDGYRLLKIDTLDNSSISDPIVAKLTAALETVPTDAVVFSDFRHGIFNRRTLARLIGAIPPGVFRVADSQVASRWGNITDFRGFDLITPNEREARFALGDQDSGIRPLAHNLFEAAACRVLILKMGERGVHTSYLRDGEAAHTDVVLDSFADAVLDPVGAGDALLAYGTLALLETGSPSVATIIGSLAAACECEVDGNVPVTPADLVQKLDAVEKQAHFS